MTRKSVFLCLFLFLFFLLLYLFYESSPILNNGDYQRTLRSSIRVPIMEDAGWYCGRARVRPVVWQTTMEIIHSLHIRLSHYLGYGCVGPLSMFMFLSFLYLLGSFVFLLAAPAGFFNLLLVLLPVFFYGEYLGSFYEEAASLVLVPFLLLSIRLSIRSGEAIRWAGVGLFLMVSAGVLYSKAFNVLLAPLFLLAVWFLVDSGRSRLILSGISALMFSLICYVSVFSLDQNKLPNNYNRIFNGLGWAVQGVEKWGEVDFEGRVRYFSEHHALLQSKGVLPEIVPNKNLWGTSYWPKGLEYWNSLSVEGRHIFMKTIAPRTFFNALSDFDVLSRWVISVGGVFLMSDYSISYLKQPEGKLLALRDRVLSNFGWIWVVGACAFFILNSKIGSFVAIFMIGSPFVMVVGDGFYEFEKHLAAFFMIFPVFLLPFYVVLQKGSGPS